MRGNLDWEAAWLRPGSREEEGEEAGEEGGQEGEEEAPLIWEASGGPLRLQEA